ncbi:manganese efflux pump [Alginatibacterium sediminis]|uniref:Putative manganese efflux pump MntP n=1 Tax=Alginatibacterium sediminis TaxID=2164068 RepID=A0A420EBH0_9ALTE|nr:manganese efflux pump MntP family protein [Alginatibacterium sediminis]RKF18028.1 manganese efflux pump [Alginatibacterium sediminis]
MLELVVLALALSMDAFAVSIGLGAKHQSQTRSLAIRCAAYFGGFQGIMPLVGYLGGKGVLSWVEAYAHVIAFVLLALIGLKMLYESFQEEIGEDICKITHRVLYVLAIATSIDAMAAGFSLTILDVHPFVACLIIAATTSVFSALGVVIGARSGTWLESKAEAFGGVVLILLGFKMLLI